VEDITKSIEDNGTMNLTSMQERMAISGRSWLGLGSKESINVRV
jgi:hypothetical protein